MQQPLLRLAAVVLTAPAFAQSGVVTAGVPPLHCLDHQQVDFSAPSTRHGKGSYGIYLPKGYRATQSAGRTYPWAIWIGDGGPADQFRLLGAPVVDALRVEGKVPEMILVVPTFERPTSWQNASRFGDLEDLIMKDLFDHVRTHWRVSTARNECAILGDGNGGWAALRIAIRYPETFGTVAAHSMPVWPADPADLTDARHSTLFGTPFDRERWDADVPMAMLAKKGMGELAGLRIYFDVRADEPTGLRERTESQIHEFQRLGIEPTFRLSDAKYGEGHASLVREGLPHSLAFLAAGFAGRDAAPSRCPSGRSGPDAEVPQVAASRAVAADVPRLLSQLADPGQRDRARERLLMLGMRAVPTVVSHLDAADPELRRELLTLLQELGPEAGEAVPQLMHVMQGMRGGDFARICETLAELAPCRPADFTIDLEMVNLQFVVIYARLRDQQGEMLASLLAMERLRHRAAFPRHPDLAMLQDAVQGPGAWRAELAVELLGQRGAEARPALPALCALLVADEPRLLLTSRTVPMHRKAARAVLAIAPDGPEAELARAVLAGKVVPSPAAQPIPERARVRIAELLAELEQPANREAAAANLLALGRLCVPDVIEALSQPHSEEYRETLLHLVRELGPLASTAVPTLLDLLVSLTTAHTSSVLDALSATAPWCTDVVPPMFWSCLAGSLSILDHRIQGKVSDEFLTNFYRANGLLRAAMLVDIHSSILELRQHLQSADVLVRLCALAVVKERRDAARSLLPELVAMLDARQPLEVVQLVHAAQQPTQVDRTARVRRCAARAILTAVAPGDPLGARARSVLAQPEPEHGVR